MCDRKRIIRLARRIAVHDNTDFFIIRNLIFQWHKTTSFVCLCIVYKKRTEKKWIFLSVHMYYSAKGKCMGGEFRNSSMNPGISLTPFYYDTSMVTSHMSF